MIEIINQETFVYFVLIRLFPLHVYPTMTN